MQLSQEIAKQFRQAYFGKNWSEVCLKELLLDIDLNEATSQVHSFNTISELVYHINYYVAEVTKVLEKKPFEAKDKNSFNVPPLHTELEWQQMVIKTLNDGEKFANLIGKMPDEDLWKDMSKKEYGSNLKNFQGILEHFYYHMGQISLIKKILKTENF